MYRWCRLGRKGVAEWARHSQALSSFPVVHYGNPHAHGLLLSPRANRAPNLSPGSCIDVPGSRTCEKHTFLLSSFRVECTRDDFGSRSLSLEPWITGPSLTFPEASRLQVWKGERWRSWCFGCKIGCGIERRRVGLEWNVEREIVCVHWEGGLRRRDVLGALARWAALSRLGS